MSIARVAVIGELNVDLVASGLSSFPSLGQEVLATDFQLTLGSASAIFASGISKLGHEVSFFSMVGNDAFGRFCLRALQEIGIATDNVIEDPAERTGVTISLSNPTDRALVTFLGAISSLRVEQLPLAELQGYSHLHLTSYFLQDQLRPSFPQIMRTAKRYGLSVSFDPNADPTSRWIDPIWEVLRLTDVLFVNEKEAQQLTRCDDTEKAIDVLGSKLSCVVIKLGAQGAVAIRDGKIVSATGFRVKALDTTGAGDSFAAGFLHGYLEGSDLYTSLKFGNACGALSTLGMGGTSTQPSHEEIMTFLQKAN